MRISLPVFYRKGARVYATSRHPAFRNERHYGIVVTGRTVLRKWYGIGFNDTGTEPHLLVRMDAGGTKVYEAVRDLHPAPAHRTDGRAAGKRWSHFIEDQKTGWRHAEGSMAAARTAAKARSLASGHAVAIVAVDARDGVEHTQGAYYGRSWREGAHTRTYRW